MKLKLTLGLVAALLMGVLTTVQSARAASGPEIDADVEATLSRFQYQIGGAEGLLRRAAGVLVFPSVVKAGMGFGGEYGEGGVAAYGGTGGCGVAADGGTGGSGGGAGGVVGGVASSVMVPLFGTFDR